MAKYFNNRIKTGKLAGSVFAVRYGDVIERAYNPIVANPSTPSQVAQRAKLKMMSQLSAVVSSAIAMPRVGAVSARNRFVKKNFSNATYQENIASVAMENIQLTDSIVALPELSASRTDTTRISVQLAQADAELDAVQYYVFLRTGDNEIRYYSTRRENESQQGFFGCVLSVPNQDVVIYAYGVRANSESGRAVFGDLTIPVSLTMAELMVSYSLGVSDITLTETKGAVVAAQQ